MKKIFAAFTFILLAGCATPAFQRPIIEAPQGWNGAAAGSDSLSAAWLKEFGSAEMEDLIARAKAGNTDLRAALQRIEQARAQVTIANATLFPSVSAGDNLARNNNGGTSTTYNANLAVSYEVDLFRRNANNREAAASQLQATTFDRDALDLVVTSETAQRYFEILTLKERIRLTEQNIKIFQDVSGIIDARFREGAASGLEVSQQNTALANARASLSTLRQQLTTTQNALALLLGLAPQQMQTVFAQKLDQLHVPQLQPSQPATLLERRPDIRAQEEILHAANADLAIARSNIYPSLTIGTTGSLAAASLSASPDFAVNVVASLAQRIFEGGRLRGEVQLAEAEQRELVENYRSIVLTAFRETEDALAGVTAATEREQQLAIALKESRNSHAIACDRYLNGAEDFLTLLDAQRTLLQAEDSYTQAKLARLASVLTLFQALGGGWAAPAS